MLCGLGLIKVRRVLARILNFALACWLAAAVASAEDRAQLQQPWMRLVEKPWEQISDQRLFEAGKIALGERPSDWHHAETEHFVVHFHKRPDALKVMRLAEFYYEQIKTDLQATQDRFDRKNHVFLFEKKKDWHRFVADVKVEAWAAGFSMRSELFMDSREGDGDFASGRFAHEMTHCVFYRFVPKRIPMWLNEGFAEFESGNAYAKFKGNGGGNHSGAASFPLKKLLEATAYPTKENEIQEFYRTSERLVRFLLTKLDRSRFVPLVMKLADGAKLETAVVEVYPDRFSSFDEFVRHYEKF